MEVYLIRHTTPLTQKGQIYGRTDVALGDSFEEESKKIIAQLPVQVAAIYSSPSSRCTLLAAAIRNHYMNVSVPRNINVSDPGNMNNSVTRNMNNAVARNMNDAVPRTNTEAEAEDPGRADEMPLELPLQTDEALYELDFGFWEGKTWDTIDRAASETWMTDFVHLSPPGGETMLEMQKRVISFWDNLMQRPYENVCIVTHGGVIRILLAMHRSITLQDSFSIKVDMAEVFKLSVSS